MPHNQHGGKTQIEKDRKELVRKYIERIGHSNFSNRTLARQIVNENPDLWAHTKDPIGTVRSMIQRFRCNGTKAYSEDQRLFVREEMKPSEYMKQYMIQGESTAKPIWQLPKELRKVLVISDLHIPFHHNEAIEAALNYGFEQGIDAIYINGDLMDQVELSKFLKDKDARDIQYELDLTREFLEGLVSLGVKVFYKAGNHDHRLSIYLARQAPELLSLDVLQLPKLLGLEELGIEYIHDRQLAKFGKLSVVHGHEFGESVFSPVNPARGLFLRAKSSVLAGHNHQTSSHHENNLNGDATACFSTGCLCDMKPNYRPFAALKWNHGAAIVEIEENGDFSVDNFRIIDGKIR